MQEELIKIEKMISDNITDEALDVLNRYIEANPECDDAYFLRGNVYRKLTDWKNAISDYATAKNINPESPAATAYDACIEIMNFFNTDLYNP